MRKINLTEMHDVVKKAQLTPGNVVTLTVVRASDFGVFFDAGTGNTNDDILLHKQQQIGDGVAIGDEVTVYLYLDPKGRLTASMRLPKLEVGQVARVSVINTTKDGAFVDIGAERGVFMPFAGMRGNLKCGDKVWVKLYVDKSGRSAVSMEVEDELRQAAVPAVHAKIGDMVTGSLYNFSEEGAFLFTSERYIAFLHNSEFSIRPKVGEEITARITHVRDDGRINVSMRPLKQTAMEIDAAAILALLYSRNGKMPYGDDTAPELIKERFGISKSAFKRALGNLIRTGYVEQREGWTYLLEITEEE
jgi:predicted RNA-binding protein (virulence factor B family)